MPRAWSAVLALGLLLAIPAAPAVAQQDDDVLLSEQQSSGKKKGGFWERLRLGANASFMSGLDRIRSNSANLVTFRDIQIISDVLRFEPRVRQNSNGFGQVSMSPIFNEDITSLSFNVVTDFIRDPRKDFGVKQELALEETLWAVLNAAYDLKTWRHGTLFLQLDGGYYQGDVRSLEIAVDIAEQAILNPVDQDLTADDRFQNYQYVYPSVGDLTQTPVSLSALWQFRPRSPFRPYVGLGIGYLFASLDEDPTLANVNSNLAGISYQYALRGEVISSGILGEESIVTDVQEDTLWTWQGGLEYNINRNWSVYLDARYIQTPARVRIRVQTPDGGMYQLFGEGIQRSDAVDDVPGIGSAEALIDRLLSLSVEEAVALVADIDEMSPDPRENEASFFTSFPVEIGTPISITIPSPTNGEPSTVPRQSKLFVNGGDLQLDSYSLGVGFRYRY